jgi:hypothetical protein
MSFSSKRNVSRAGGPVNMSDPGSRLGWMERQWDLQRKAEAQKVADQQKANAMARARATEAQRVGSIRWGNQTTPTNAVARDTSSGPYGSASAEPYTASPARRPRPGIIARFFVGIGKLGVAIFVLYLLIKLVPALMR